MLQLFGIMLNVIAPIMLVMAIGFGIGRRFDPDPRTISVYLIYFFTPALVFQGIYETELSGGQVGGITVLVIGVALVMMVLSIIAARWFGYEARQEGALTISVILVNAANYGIPLNTFAFGDEAGNIAIVYYVVSAIVGNILGVYFASRGTGSIRDAILNVFKVPIVYAAVIGLVLNVLNIDLPLVLQRSVIDIAAQASIPLMLALLGLQLSRVRFRPDYHRDQDTALTLATNIPAVLTGAGLRLLVSPLVALGFALMLGLTGDVYSVAIVQSSMPTAVLASALATQFGSDARFVSAITVVSTLASILTLSVLILLLGGVTA
jgi:malate permease and related proteins